MAKKLYVGNLSFKAKESDLQTLFEQAGKVVEDSVKIITEAGSGRSKGFGFVEMSTEEEAKKAIDEFNGKSFFERNLVVSEAKPQEKREKRGFGGGKSSGRGRFNKR